MLDELWRHTGTSCRSIQGSVEKNSGGGDGGRREDARLDRFSSITLSEALFLWRLSSDGMGAMRQTTHSRTAKVPQSSKRLASGRRRNAETANTLELSSVVRCPFQHIR